MLSEIAGGMGGLGSIWSFLGINTTLMQKGAAEAKGILAGVNAEMTATEGRSIGMGAIVGKSLLGIGLAAGVVAIASGKMAADFDKSMREVYSMIRGGEERFEQLKDSVVDLSKGTEQSANELSEAFYWIVSAMPDASDATRLKTLELAAKGASAGVADMADTADVLTTAMNAWKIEDPTRVMDVLLLTVERGKTKLSELAQNFGKVAASAAMAGVPIEDVGAAAASMTRAGISTDRTMMSLNRTFLGLAKPSEEAAAWFKSMGYESGIAMLRTEGFAGVLGKLHDQFGDNVEAIVQLFPNIRELLSYLSLAGVNFEDFLVDMKMFGDATGQTDDMVKELEKTIQYKWNVALNAGKATLIELGEKVLPVASRALESVTGILQGKNEVANNFFNIFQSGASIVGNFGQALLSVKPIIYAVAGALAALKVVGLFTAGPTTIAGGLNALHVAAVNARPILGATSGLITGIGYAGIGAAVGLGFLISAFKDMDSKGQAAYENMLKTDKAAGELGRSLKPLVDRYLELRTAVRDLNAAGKDSTAQTAEMKAAANELASVAPELVASFDAQGDAIIKADAQLNRYIDSLLAIGGLEITTKGQTGELQAQLQTKDKLQKSYEKEKQSLRYIQTYIAGISGNWQDAESITAVMARDVKAGEEAAQAFLTRMADSGKIRPLDWKKYIMGSYTPEDELVGDLQDALRAYFEEAKNNGALVDLKGKIDEVRLSIIQLRQTLLEEAFKAGASTGVLSDNIKQALQSVSPEFRQFGLDAAAQTAAGMLAARGMAGEEANQWAQVISNRLASNDFTSTGNAWADEVLAGLRGQFTPDELAAIFNRTMTQAAGAASAEVGVEVKFNPETGQLETARAGAGVPIGTPVVFNPETGKYEIAKTGAASPIRPSWVPQPDTSRADAERRRLSETFWGKYILQVQTQVNPIFEHPYEAGVYIGKQLGAGAGAAAPDITLGLTGGGGDVVSELTTSLGNLKRAWEEEVGAVRSLYDEMKAKPFAEVEQAIMAVTASAAQLDVWRKLRSELANTEANFKQLTDGLKQATDAYNYWTQSVNIKGLDARDDKSFDMAQKIQKLELGILKAKRDGNFEQAALLSMQKKEAEKEKEIYDLETAVDFDPKIRAIQEAMEDTGKQEKSWKDIVNGIKKSKIEMDKYSKAAAAMQLDIDEYKRNIDELANYFKTKMGEMAQAANGVGAAVGGAMSGGGYTGGGMAAPPVYTGGTGSPNIVVRVPVSLDGKIIADSTTRIVGGRASARRSSGGRY